MSRKLGIFGTAVVASLIGTGTLSAQPRNEIVQSNICRKDAVVLQHRFRGVASTEMASLGTILKFSHLTGRALTAEYRIRSKAHGTDDLCSAYENSCAKLYREARANSFSTFRRSKAFACSADYKLSTSISKTAWKSPTNDSLIKNQKYAIDSLDLARAWKMQTGQPNIVVAIIDTGVDYNHPDLAGNILPGKNFSLGQETDDPMDDNGHGTHVAGTIGALGNNGFGVAGMSWNTRILPLKFLDKNGSGYLSDALRAINYMVYAKNTLGLDIRVSNNSWGGGSYSDSLFTAITLAKDNGILFVAAAGNEANDNDAAPSYPASYKVSNVISVAAYDSDLMLAYFSNYGKATVDIAAPGVRIASTYAGGGYAYLSGTSMATPHVSGALALLASSNPTLSAADLRQQLLGTARYNSELRPYVHDGAQLNILNLLRNRKNQSYAGLKAAAASERARKK